MGNYYKSEDYEPLYKGNELSLTLEDLERALVDRYGTDIECGCNTWEGGWFSVLEVLRTAEEEVTEYI